jgi:HNH endonuclease
MNAADFDRFIEHIEPCGECWQWTGGKWGTYGRFVINGDNHAAHVLSYKHFKGAVPPGLFVCHECDNRLCVNPNHLFLGTCQDNWNDMRAKGRHARGELQWSAKLTDADIINMRRLRSEGISGYRKVVSHSPSHGSQNSPWQLMETRNRTGGFISTDTPQEKNTMKNRIIIEVSGGVADVTASTVPSLELYIIDWDNLKYGDADPSLLEPRELQDDRPAQFEERLAEIKEEAKKYLEEDQGE